MRYFKHDHKHKRILAILLVVVLLLSLGVPSLAIASTQESNTPKQEVAYIDLDTDGTVNSIYVVNIFELDEDGRIIDYGDYTALRNMTTNDEIQFEDETVKIDTKAGKLYYEGRLDSNVIPWKFTIRYYMDGKEFSADELAGKSGAFKMTMAIRQNPHCRSAFFENYSLQAAFTLDTNICENITADGATIANVGADKQLSYIILAGKEKDITITADVTDFEMDGISINGIPLNMDVDFDLDDNAELNDQINELKDAAIEFDDGAADLLDGAEELRDGADELRDGVLDLQDGSNDLYDGAIELKDGADELYDGADDLDDGAADLVDGAEKLQDGAYNLRKGAAELDDSMKDAVAGGLAVHTGAGQLRSGAENLNSGASELYSGLNKLRDQNDPLVDGAYSVFVQLTAAAEDQLNESLSAAGIPDVTLTPENYDTVLTGLLTMLSGGTGGGSGDTDTGSGDSGNTGAESGDSGDTGTDNGSDTGDSENLNAESSGADENTSSENDDETETEPSVPPQSAAAYQAILSLKEQLDSYNDFYTGLRKYTRGVASAAEGARSLNAGTSALYDGADELYTGTGNLYEGLLKLKDGSAKLRSGTITLRNGTVELYDGVLELKDGTTELLDGVAELRDGTIELYDGTVELKDGVIELLDGAIELYDGTVELYDGTVELKDGTFEFRDKTSNIDTELKDKITKAIEDVLGGDFDKVSFVSEKNTNIESVQFVIKTDGISIEDNDYVDISADETLTFWQKLLRLFGL